jgi:TRAP-type C4-dicarboxylate transport system substrate-binding protein
MKKLLTVLLLVFVVAAAAACGSSGTDSGNSGSGGTSGQNSGGDSAKKITLTYAFFAPENTFPAAQMKFWAEELNKRTNGQVEVQMFFGGTLLDAANMYDGVKSKIADIGLSAMTYEPGRFPLIGIAEMPAGYPNGKVASQVINELMKEFPPESFKDYKIITAFATEPAYIMSTKRISNLNEMKGAQLRISGNLTPVIQALGGAPVGMSMGEVPEALQTGVVEGNISSREVLKDLQLAEFTKYVTDFPLSITTFAAVMNKDVWESLPPNVQQVIDELRDETAAYAGEYLDNHVQESLEWAKAEHNLEIVTLSDEEKAKWSEKIAPLQAQYVKQMNDQGLPGDEFKKRLDELIQQFSQ